MKKRKFIMVSIIAAWAFNLLANEEYYPNRRDIKMIEKEYEFQDVYFGRMKAKFPKKVRSFGRGLYSINDVAIDDFPWPSNEGDINNQESDYYKGFSKKYDGVGGNPHDSVKILAAPKRDNHGTPIGRPPDEPLDLTTKIGFLGNNGERFTPEADKYFVQKPNILPRDALYDAVFQDHIRRKIFKKDDFEEDDFEEEDAEIPLIIEERWYFNNRVKIVYFYEDRNDKTKLIAHALLHLSNGYGAWISTDMLSYGADLSLQNLENILKDIIKSFIDIREQIIFMDDARHYFFMDNNALVLPYNKEQVFGVSMYGHKLFDYLRLKLYRKIDYTHTKGWLVNQVYDISTKIMFMAFGANSENLRACSRKVGSLDGEEIIIKITDYKSKNYTIGFMWKYPGDQEHQHMEIKMKLPDNISENDLTKSIAMWDYILDSIVLFDKK